MKIAKSGICIFCKKPGAKDYAIHGRGKNAHINYFYPEYYMKDVNQKKEAQKHHEA